MKRLTALALVLALLLGMAPVSSFADTLTFQADATAKARAMDPDEKAFREWAAELVKQYRDSYCLYQNDSSEIQRLDLAYQHIYETWGRYISDTVMKQTEGALFSPYYDIAQKKRLYDQSIYAKKVNMFGVVTDETAYTYEQLYDDPAKRQEIYTWILAETIQNKAEADPTLLTGTRYISARDKGYYRYDLSTGTMTYDDTLSFVQDQAVTDAEADWANFVVDGLNLAVKAYLAKENLMGQGTAIMKKARNKAYGKSGMDEIINTLKEDLLNTLIDTVTKAAREAISELRDNAKNELTNKLRGKLAESLANAYVNRNRNIIGYLRSTYLDNASSLVSLYDSQDQAQGYEPRGEFRAAVRAFIQKLEQDNLDVMQKMASDELIRRTIVNFTTNNALPLEKVLDTETILYHVFTVAVTELLDGLIDDVITFLASVAKEKLAGGGANKKIVAAALDFAIDDLLGEALHRLADGLKANMEKYDPAKLGLTSASQVQSGAGTWWASLGDEIGKQFEGFGGYAAQKGLDFVFSAIVLYQKDGGESDDPNGYKKAFDQVTDPNAALDGHEAGSFLFLTPWLEKKGAMELQDWIVYFCVLSMAASVDPFCSALEKKTDYLREADKRNLKATLKGFSQAANRLAAEFDLDKAEDLLRATGQVLALFYSLQQQYPNHNSIGLLKDEFLAALQYALVWKFRPAEEAPAEFQLYRQASTVANRLENALKDTKLWSSLADSLLGGVDPEKAMENVFKAEIYAFRQDHPGTDVGEKEKEIIRQSHINMQKQIEGDPDFAAIVKTLTELFQSLWEPAKQFAGSFWKAVNSTGDALHNEDVVSLIAQRINAVQQVSSALQQPLGTYTKGGVRTGLYNGNSLDVLRAMDARSDSTTFDYKFMNPQEILSPDLTPNLKNVKALTDDIMTQLNLDAVGMAAYTSLAEGWKDYVESDFFRVYVLPDDALMESSEAARRTQLIVTMINRFDNRYDHAWDRLFQ